jgi:hypothetical protein
MTNTAPESEQEGRDQAEEKLAEEEGQPFPTNPIPANADLDGEEDS